MKPSANTTRILAQLRAILDLTNTEIQIAETRLAQASSEDVSTELSQNADNARERAQAIESAIRGLGGLPDMVGPLLGRAAAAVKAITEQAQPLEEALLADLNLEDQLLNRARYVKALAVAERNTEIQRLADRLVNAHAATVDWLTTVLAEDALGGPAALRRTPAQAVVAAAVRAANMPMNLSVRGVERAIETARSARPAVQNLVDRGTHLGEVAAKAVRASGDAALHTAEQVVRREGEDGAADALHSVRRTAGVLESDELPIQGYDDLAVRDAVEAVRDLKEPSDIRAVIAYEEAHKNRQRIVSAGQTRVAAIAQGIVGID